MLMPTETTKIEVFIDPATLPTINFFMHFAESCDDKDTIRLFGLQRYEIPLKIQKSYPEGIIKSCLINVNDFKNIHSLLEQTIKEQKNIELTVFLNISYCLHSFIPIWNIYCENREKILSLNLELYDEGSLGVYELHRLSENNVDLTHLDLANICKVQDIFTSKNSCVADYLWGSILPARYHFLNTSYLESNPKLLPLKNAISAYHKIDFTRYSRLTDRQKVFFLSLFGISEEAINEIIALFNHQKTFLFIGTVIFDEEQTMLMWNVHLQLLREYISKSGKYYLGSDDYRIIYKAHPATGFENIIKKVYPDVVFIPSDIPLELLFMLGLMPDKIGGFASSSYFSIPQSHISDVTFITKRDENERNKLEHYRQQYRLRNIFIELGLLTEAQAHFYDE